MKELTKEQKYEFLNYALNCHLIWNGICGRFSRWAELNTTDMGRALKKMKTGFPELYKELKVRLKRSRPSAYAWKYNKARINFIKKFMKQFK